LKTLAILLLLSSAVFARFNANPTHECEAFNNMKHTKNTHHVVLELGTTYTVLKHHKGQNLVLVSGEQPAQRWVDDSCFAKSKKTANKNVVHKKRTNRDDVAPIKSRVININDELTAAALHMNKSEHTKKYQNRKTTTQNLLVLSWHNAFCETHKYKKECKRGLLSSFKKRYTDTHFILHGLWPQPRSKMYCGVNPKEVARDKHKQWNRLPDLGLSSETKKALLEVMPGMRSNLHKHEWFKHGSCYGGDADTYYKDAIALVHQVNDSKVGNFFQNNIGKTVTLKQIRHLFDSSFGVGSGKRVEMKCRNSLMIELWLHLGSGNNDLATLLKSGKTTRSRCQKGRIDKAGFR